MPLEAIIAILLGIGLIILLIIVFKVKRGSVKNSAKELDVRFNQIKTIPLTFKLNKASYIAKINDELARSVEEQRSKLEKCQNDIDEIQKMMIELDDLIDAKKYKQAKAQVEDIEYKIGPCEKEVNEMEAFLDSITQREQVQREHANELKEQYREIKQAVANSANEMTIAYNGVENKLRECEDLFSNFEDQIYANEFIKASEDLEKINDNLDQIKKAIGDIPALVQMAKGTIPTLMEQVENYYLKTKTKGICTNHISVEIKLKELAENVNKCIKEITSANTEGMEEKLNDYRGQLEGILDALTKENLAFDDLKKVSVKIDQDLRDIEKTYYYIQKVFDTDKEKYDLDDLDGVLTNTPKTLEKYRLDFNDIGLALKNGITPSSTILVNAQKIAKDVEGTLNDLLDRKHTIDKTSNDEARAHSQVIKLQIVLNEVEVKILQNRLLALSNTHKADIKKGHDYIKEVKGLLNAIPLDIKALNDKLKEAIDFIYKLYNNINNIIGTAILVERGIVVGNKYRSSYNDVDAELSKAEFSYMNGEYTQALTIVMACIDRLLPSASEEKIVDGI